jgi:hypothetical protein
VEFVVWALIYTTWVASWVAARQQEQSEWHTNLNG